MKKYAINTSFITASDMGNKDTFPICPGEEISFTITFPKEGKIEIVLIIHSKVLETFDKGMLLLARVL